MTHVYNTASTMALFINGLHLDQCYQLQHKETLNKIPIYGYNDYYYSKIALGRNLVQGILVVNFIFPGYLNTVLDTMYNDKGPFVPRLYNYDITERGTSQKEKLQESIRDQLKTELPPNTNSQEKSARASYIASLISKDKNTKEQTKKALEKMFVSQDDGFRITDLTSPIGLENEGITLDVYYQDPSYVNWYVRFDKVHFYEVSQIASQAGAEGSSDPLYEIYSWIASKRTIKIIGEVQ